MTRQVLKGKLCVEVNEAIITSSYLNTYFDKMMSKWKVWESGQNGNWFLNYRWWESCWPSSPEQCISSSSSSSTKSNLIRNEYFSWQSTDKCYSVIWFCAEWHGRVRHGIWYTGYGGKCNCWRGNQELQFAWFDLLLALRCWWWGSCCQQICLVCGCDHLQEYHYPALHWSLSGQVVVSWNDRCLPLEWAESKLKGWMLLLRIYSIPP